MPRQYEHLEHAPITEALLDLRVAPDPGDLRFLEAFRSQVQATYPTTRHIQHVQAEVVMDNAGAQMSQTGLTQQGEIYWNADQTRAVQARRDGFTVNHVKHYQDWEAVRTQALQLWPLYVGAARPMTVQRCALRYINRIEVPPEASPKDLLLTRPAIGGSLPDKLDEFLMRVVLPFADGRQAIITELMDPGGSPGDRALILDIEVGRAVALEPEDPKLWDEFEALRQIKNACFFDSLPESVWRRFQ